MQVIVRGHHHHRRAPVVPENCAVLPLGMTSAPAVSLLGCHSASPESSSESATSDGELTDNTTSESSESEEEEDQDDHERDRRQTHAFGGDRQPTSAPACLSDGAACRFPQSDQCFPEVKADDSQCVLPLGLGLGMGFMDTNNRLPQDYQLPPSARFSPSTPPSLRRRTAGPHNRIASASFSAKKQTGVDEEGDAKKSDKLQRRSTFTAHATITRSGPRSASDTLRSLVALSCQGAAQPDSDAIQDHPPGDKDAVEQIETHSAAQDAARSAASRRLFAALNRKTVPEAEQGKSYPVNEQLVAATAGFSARRSAPNRPPSLEQLRMRVLSGSAVGSNAAAGSDAVCQSASAAMRSPTRARNTPSSPSHRSVSCPLRDQVGPWYQFGGVTVTVTPPTPRPQPRSPIMGYVLTNAGRPCHNVGFIRSQDDLELLKPPSFEIAPGKQKILEDRARESLAALRAIADAEQHRRRGGGQGGPAESLQDSPHGQQRGIGLGWPASPGSQGACRFGSGPATRTLLGGPRETSASGNPRSRLEQHEARALGRSGGLRRSSGRVSRSMDDKNGKSLEGKYVPPPLRQRGERRACRITSAGGRACSAVPVRSACIESDSDDDGCNDDEVIVLDNPTASRTDRGCARTSSRHERWRRVEEMRNIGNDGIVNGAHGQRQAARQRMLSKLGQRQGVQCAG